MPIWWNIFCYADRQLIWILCTYWYNYEIIDIVKHSVKIWSKKTLLILNLQVSISIESIHKLLHLSQEFQLTLRTFKFEFFFNPLTKIWMHPSDSLLQLRFKSRSVVLISNALDNVRAPRIWKPFQEISSFSKCLFTYKISYTLDIIF